MTTKYLDGLRGLAAVTVVLQHTGSHQILEKGSIAVEAFFVLSSFLITRNLFVNIKKFKHEKQSFTNIRLFLVEYGIKRFLRVWPIYFVSLLLIRYWPLIASFYHIHPIHQHFSIFQTAFALSQDYLNVFWTIPVEMVYYAIAPIWVLAYVYLPSKKSQILFYIVTAAVASINIFQIGYKKPRGPGGYIYLHYGPFLLGSLVAVTECSIIQQSERIRNSIKSHHMTKFVWYGISLINFLIFYELASDGKIPIMIHRFHYQKYEPVAFNIAIMMILEWIYPTPFSRFLELNFFRYIGKISYPLYAYHPVVIGAIAKYFRVIDLYQRDFLYFFGSVLFGAIIHHTVEERLLAPLTRKLCGHVRRFQPPYTLLPKTKTASVIAPAS